MSDAETVIDARGWNTCNAGENCFSKFDASDEAYCLVLATYGSIEIKPA